MNSSEIVSEDMQRECSGKLESAPAVCEERASSGEPFPGEQSEKSKAA
jgi:hypothetical protein